ncbi:MAG: hypothetical protein NC548_27210 [Lachnospiraceae bacterium]|nr:hypothetical protein [Lachnospiraceae bacterium]
MITLALFEKMAEDGVGGLTRNQDFFWEEVPLQHSGNPASGVWLVTRPGNISTTHRGLNLRTTVDFYIATENKVKTEALHDAIRKYLTKNMCFCELSGSVGGISYKYSNIRIRPTTTPQNAGATENNLIVKVASTELVYDEVNN